MEHQHSLEANGGHNTLWAGRHSSPYLAHLLHSHWLHLSATQRNSFLQDSAVAAQFVFFLSKQACY